MQALEIYIDEKRFMIGLILNSEIIIYQLNKSNLKLEQVFYKTGYDVRKIHQTAKRKQIHEIFNEMLVNFFSNDATTSNNSSEKESSNGN